METGAEMPVELPIGKCGQWGPHWLEWTGDTGQWGTPWAHRSNGGTLEQMWLVGNRPGLQTKMGDTETELPMESPFGIVSGLLGLEW